MIISLLFSLIPPTNLGSVSKSFSISPGFAFSGQTPNPKFFPAFNLPPSSKILQKVFSINPGSTVLSTTTIEYGFNILFNFFATDSIAE